MAGQRAGGAAAAAMTIPCRPPTINQAVEILMRIITRDERKAQLSWMRRHFGEDFAGIEVETDFTKDIEITLSDRHVHLLELTQDGWYNHIDAKRLGRN